MRTDSHRFVATLIAAGFVAGWLSGSWVNPPTAATQERPPRVVPPAVEVLMPHIALDAVTAPTTTPAALRNPFAFVDRHASGREGPRPAHLIDPSRVDGVPAEMTDGAALPLAAPAPPPWRVVGVAADADGRVTAIVSGQGDVLLLALGDRLPDGAVVVELDEAHVVVEQASGTRITMRLP